MKLLQRMGVRQFIPVFLLALLFFILLLELVDLFQNITRYMDLEVPIPAVMRVAWLYLPKCVSYSLPIALLFAISFSLGNFYSNNELIAVFSSGTSLYRFIRPFLFIGLMLSVVSFFFQEEVVISSYRQKNNYMNELLNIRTRFDNNNLAVFSPSNALIYHADYFNNDAETLSGLELIELYPDRGIKNTIFADYAVWNGTHWELTNARVFSWSETNEFLEESFHPTYSRDIINEDPATFRRSDKKVDELPWRTARDYIFNLQKAGFPYRNQLTKYYQRFSFTLTPLIVVMISGAFGGRFKKNILLMSLLLSLCLSVLYYVFQMISTLLADFNLIPPLAGAWISFLFFFFLSIFLLKIART